MVHKCSVISRVNGAKVILFFKRGMLGGVRQEESTDVNCVITDTMKHLTCFSDIFNSTLSLFWTFDGEESEGGRRGCGRLVV